MKNPKLTMSLHPSLGDRCKLGKHCYATDGSPTIILYKGPHVKLEIGSFVSFGPKVTIHVGGEHFTEYVSAYPFSGVFDDVPAIECVKTKGDIVIGSDVWIGTCATILSGVTIGHGAVIGASAVVAKDVEPYTVVVGNPLKVIRTRFPEHQVKRLLEIAWWNWSDEEIDRAIPYIMNKDVERFLQYAEAQNGRSHAV